MRELRLGDLSVTTVIENLAYPMRFADFLPDVLPEMLTNEREWLEPRFADLAQGVGYLAFHSYLVTTPQHRILIDACIGNDKDRNGFAAFHQLRSPWLENLRARGVDPESIDYVMCTHLHPDHVGWNTRLHDGRWVPTFPRAKYLFARAEYQHRRAAYDADPGAYANAFADSILPIIESQQALLVDSGFALDRYLHLEAAPGHTPGNVIVHLQDRAMRAVLSGDVIHHPIQVVYPEHSAVFCEDRAASARYRQAFVERYADQDTWILPAHFPYPTAGRITRHGARCRFKFADESPSSG